MPDRKRRSFARLVPLLLALLAGCAAPTMEARLQRSEERSGAAETALDEAEAALAALQPTPAEARLADAAEALGDPDAALYPDHELLVGRLEAARGRLGEVRAEKERADREAELEALRDRLVKALEELRNLQDALGSVSVGRRDVELARDSASEVEEALAAGKEYEAKDRDYAAYAGSARRKRDEALLSIERASRVVAFTAGPVVKLRDAVAARKRAEAVEGDDRRELQDDALAGFRACVDAGIQALAVQPSIASANILVEATATTPAALTERCRKEAEAVAAAIAADARAAKAAKRPGVKPAKKEPPAPKKATPPSKLKPDPTPKRPAPKKGDKIHYIR